MHKKRFKNDAEENVRFGSVELFENYVRHLISDLIIIALKRFEHIACQDLLSKSPFVCTCVRELWKLLQLCSDLLHCKGQTEVDDIIYSSISSNNPLFSYINH